ncbi:MAG: CAP domain-containing protein, partial [Pseudomonadota bacterium]|nr:CAP domain-containing protein [Pseudomonadota bacterium]
MRWFPQAAFLIAALAVAACAPSRPPWADGATVHTEMPPNAAPQNLGGISERILALHNRERAAVGAPPLSWDPALAASAAAYAP